MANPWILALRLRTLPAAISPVLVGGAVAYYEGAFRLYPFLAAMFGAIFIQLGANYANDVSDFKKGADTSERLGPTRVTAAGLLTANQVTAGAIAWFLFASLCGVYLLSVVGWPVIAIGIASIIAAVLYVSGPIPYGYRGLGEVFVFLFFGVVAVAGTTYMQTRQISLTSLTASFPIGLLCANILIVNNVRDVETDRMANKRTLAVIFGESFSRRLYVLFLSIAGVTPLVAAGVGLLPFMSCLCLLACPIGLAALQEFRYAKGRNLNPVLGKTAKVEMVYSLLFALGIALPRITNGALP
jgi:1,4-dihydroxy-2-naphthoate octaprenyltransferase